MGIYTKKSYAHVWTVWPNNIHLLFSIISFGCHICPSTLLYLPRRVTIVEILRLAVNQPSICTQLRGRLILYNKSFCES